MDIDDEPDFGDWDSQSSMSYGSDNGIPDIDSGEDELNEFKAALPGKRKNPDMDAMAPQRKKRGS